MYLQIGENRHSVRRRIVYEDAIVYLSVTPKPELITGSIQMCRDDGLVLAEDHASDYSRQIYTGTRLTLTNAAEVSSQPKSPPEPQATRSETLAAVIFARMMLPSVAATMSADDTIAVAALYDEWTDGSYQVGDIRLAWYNGSHQPWKCRQEHDTTTYPDITPDGSAWRTFWIPFHGTSPETALPFVQPTMAEDQYKTGEMMIWTDGKVYRATMDTPYSPEEQGDAWEVVER